MNSNSHKASNSNKIIFQLVIKVISNVGWFYRRERTHRVRPHARICITIPATDASLTVDDFICLLQCQFRDIVQSSWIDSSICFATNNLLPSNVINIVWCALCLSKDFWCSKNSRQNSTEYDFAADAVVRNTITNMLVHNTCFGNESSS